MKTQKVIVSPKFEAGISAVLVGRVHSDEVDEEEVGPMYRVIIDVFEEEIEFLEDA